MAVNDIVMGAAGASGPATFVEDVFSCFLYTGNGSTQTITNGIDLSGKGGLTWIKSRAIAYSNCLFDTTRGANQYLFSNSTAANNNNSPYGITNFLSTGFTVQDDGVNGNYGVNGSSATGSSGPTYASWTFRKQPKFFDIVTWTGDGTSNRLISHNLNSVPGCVIVKCTSTARSWVVAARANDSTYRYLILNGTDSQVGSNSISTYATSTTFNLTAFTNGGRPLDDVNGNGNTYVAYLFAHNAGGFGATGTDNVISCGSFTTDASGLVTINLGYEPQWILLKRSDATNEWVLIDSMRGNPVGSAARYLSPNNANAEGNLTGWTTPTSTGFTNSYPLEGSNFIYIAIRRPMKTPTTGTEVFSPVSSTSTFPSYKTNFPVDMAIRISDISAIHTNYLFDRLRGNNNYLETNTTAAAVQNGTLWVFDYNTGWAKDTSDSAKFTWNFKRAPSFFDVVCYTGNDANRTLNHNLGVAPELMIVKRRDGATNWPVYSLPTTATKVGYLNTTDAFFTDSLYWNNTSPTSTVFTIGAGSEVNNSGSTYVAYLFASCPGVSKVGSYTGNGSSQTINCSFTTGARFVMIKRTDSTGNWYVWDTARGIVAGNDPRLSLNTTAAEVTTDDSVDAASSGFIVNQVAATNVNVNAATYIFLAIA